MYVPGVLASAADIFGSTFVKAVESNTNADPESSMCHPHNDVPKAPCATRI